MGDGRNESGLPLHLGNTNGYIPAVTTGLTVIGALVLLAGAVFAGQGLGYIPGSYMTGDMKWFWIGSAMVVGGAALIVAPRLRRGSKA